ncbi:MAG TPA: hypothetical protein VKG24_08365 [Pseudolabrys sp.]|jgi:hypothetical protein|nr:hypothetical protein [Pseudolabrys sp.]
MTARDFFYKDREPFFGRRMNFQFTNRPTFWERKIHEMDRTTFDHALFIFLFSGVAALVRAAGYVADDRSALCEDSLLPRPLLSVMNCTSAIASWE